MYGNSPIIYHWKSINRKLITSSYQPQQHIHPQRNSITVKQQDDE